MSEAPKKRVLSVVVSACDEEQIATWLAQNSTASRSSAAETAAVSAENARA